MKSVVLILHSSMLPFVVNEVYNNNNNNRESVDNDDIPTPKTNPELTKKRSDSSNYSNSISIYMNTDSLIH